MIWFKLRQETLTPSTSEAWEQQSLLVYVITCTYPIINCKTSSVKTMHSFTVIKRKEFKIVSWILWIPGERYGHWKMKIWCYSTEKCKGTRTSRLWKWSSPSAFALHKSNLLSYSSNQILSDKIIHIISYYFLIIGNCCPWINLPIASRSHPEVNLFLLTPSLK